MSHVYKFGNSGQGCQCGTCKLERLNEGAPDLADALRFALSVLVEGKAVPRDVVEHAIIDARNALTKAGVT